ncbi:MAG TPA: TolC family protein, partial [Allosphingosinicella sp.]
TSDRVALSAIAAWYDIFAYRALTILTETFAESQRELRASVEERVESGVSAPGDVARVESYIASAETRLARFRRQLANAEARFAELAGAPAPGTVERAQAPAVPVQTRDAAVLAAARSPAVLSAERIAEAARQEARAARADRLPQVSAGIDAGRYGVFENDRDYDIRGRVSVRQRLFGGVDARANQLSARARASEARADRIREESSRDAAIAWSDVAALEEQLEALESSYIAARRSRDVIVERFRAARGSLFDVVAAEDTYFQAATAYIQAIAELDAARYVLLSRTGRLLDVLAIAGAPEDARR